MGCLAFTFLFSLTHFCSLFPAPLLCTHRAPGPSLSPTAYLPLSP